MTEHEKTRSSSPASIESGSTKTGLVFKTHSIEVLRRNVADVERFLADNPHLKEELVGVARESARSGKKFGVRETLERWRWFRPVMSDGSDVKVNNNMAPILARLLIEWVPECAAFVERRASAYDEVFECRAGERA